jgi:hypothetical protein
MILIILIIAFSITVINLINITKKREPQLRNQKRRDRLIEEIRLKEKQNNNNETKSDAD